MAYHFDIAGITAIWPGSFEVIRTGEPWPVDGDGPYWLKVRHRGPGGQKWGVARGYATDDARSEAIRALAELHFTVEYRTWEGEGEIGRLPIHGGGRGCGCKHCYWDIKNDPGRDWPDVSSWTVVRN